MEKRRREKGKEGGEGREGGGLYYKLTNEPKGPGELKIILHFE